MEEYVGEHEICSLSDYHVRDLGFKLGECLYNAYKTAKETGALIVEGIIKINCGEYRRHAWNKIGDSYFDVTKEYQFERDDFKKKLNAACKEDTDELSYSYIKCVEYPINECNLESKNNNIKELSFRYSYDKLIVEANKGNI